MCHELSAAAGLLRSVQYRSEGISDCSHNYTWLPVAGFANQLFSHVAALSLAAALGADVVMPPALVRDSYDRVAVGAKVTMKWVTAPTGSIMDTDAMAEGWGRLGQ